MLRVSELRKMGGQAPKADARPGQYSGTVTRSDPDGATWVRFDGGESDTPCTATMSCAPGDKVTVNVEGGRAYVPGNETVPATGDGKALEAMAAARRAAQSAATASKMSESATRDAATANRAATRAVSDAATARAAAEGAQADAEAAKGAATAAQASAESAAGSADSASRSASDAAGDASSASASAASAAADASSANKAASTALRELATVQDVAGALEWITRHGAMASAAGTRFDENAVYFAADADGDYEVGGATYSIVEEPTPDGLAGYYTLSVDSSIENYVNVHLAMTGEGLWLLTGDGGGYRVLVATGGGSAYATPGTYVIDGSGDVVASFSATGISFDGNRSFTIGDEGASVHFDGDGRILISGDVTIGSSVQLPGRRRFVTTPAPPYDPGDVWVIADAAWGDLAGLAWGAVGLMSWGAWGDGGAVLRCAASRQSGPPSASDWVLEGRYESESNLLDAARTATGYIVDISDGMMVHPEGDETTGWRMGTAIELLRSGASYIKAWLDGAAAKVRVGLEAAGHAVLSPDGMEVYKGGASVALFGGSSRVGAASGPRFEADSAGARIFSGAGDHADVTSGGLEVYQGGSSVASFGGEARVGKLGAAHAAVTSSGMEVYGPDGATSVASFGEAVRVGKPGGSHMRADSYGIHFESEHASGATSVNGNGVYRDGDLMLSSVNGTAYLYSQGTAEAFFELNHSGGVKYRCQNQDTGVRRTCMTVDANGNAWFAGGVTQSSDRRLKEHVSGIGGASRFVMALKPVLFKRGGRLQAGFYAQDVRDADPWGTDAVGEDDDGYLTLDYQALIAPIVAHCQRLEERVSELERKDR